MASIAAETDVGNAEDGEARQSALGVRIRVIRFGVGHCPDYRAAAGTVARRRYQVVGAMSSYLK